MSNRADCLEHVMRILGIDRDPPSARDLTNELLRVAPSASLGDACVLLLDLLIATDAVAMWEVAR